MVVLFWKKLFPVSFGKRPAIRKDILAEWGKILISCIPAAIVGLLFDDQIEALFFNYQTVSVTLIVYGILFFIIENRNRAHTGLLLKFW